MSFFTSPNLDLAREIVGRYPRPRSALIPLMHLAQEQHGWVSADAMRQIADLCGVTAAEVKGTGSFYEMFKFHPVGSYLINVCTNISCMLLGGEELLEHAQYRLGIAPGETTEDNLFTLEEVECIAACTEAPCLQVNYRYRLRVSNTDFDSLLDRIRSGAEPDLPKHGTLTNVRQQIPIDRVANIVPPENAREMPVWLHRNDASTTQAVS